jgi:hypothetical protein
MKYVLDASVAFKWVIVEPDSNKQVGEVEIGQQRVVQYAAQVRVHRNVPRRAALRGDTFRLEMP